MKLLYWNKYNSTFSSDSSELLVETLNKLNAEKYTMVDACMYCSLLVDDNIRYT